MIRVGIVFTINDIWLGGANYFRNLLSAVFSCPDIMIEPVIFTDNKKDVKNFFKDFPNIEIVKTNLPKLVTPLGLLSYINRQFFSNDWFLENLLLKHNISVLSHSGYLGSHAKIPTIGWIADFQHLHLPGFFTEKEIELRNSEFKKECRLCSCIVLSSYAAQKDLAGFAPSCLPRSKVLQFVADLINIQDVPEVETLQRRYGFDGPFFHVPNQLWAHKNHKVIIEALQILKSSGRNVMVISTGNTKDHRRPDYFNSLMAFAEQSNVLDCFKVLGIIPYHDLMWLMRHSVAVINPSLFEGWSTTVEEGKSMGKRIILSDIPVHREQAPPGGIFFDPGNPHALSEAMWNLWAYRDIKADEKLIEEAKEDLPKRKREFARNYEEIVLGVLKK